MVSVAVIKLRESSSLWPCSMFCLTYILTVAAAHQCAQAPATKPSSSYSPLLKKSQPKHQTVHPASTASDLALLDTTAK